jgi:hypothetical protein
VSDQAAWDSNDDIQSFRFELGDLLIDSNGASYELVDVCEVNLLSASGNLSLSELTGLVRCHASELGNCCISKLVFPSIEEAIKSVVSFDEM